MDPLLRLLLRRLRVTATDPTPTVETAVELAKRTAEVLERFQQIEAFHANSLPPTARAKYLTGRSADDQADPEVKR